MERTTAISSMCDATLGNRSDTSMPDWPYLRNARRQPSTVWRSNFENCSCTEPKLAGTCWPSRRCSAGFGSKVSRCEGPPCMNRKITRLAVAGKWVLLSATAAAASAGKPSAERNNCRREISSDIEKLAHVEDQQTEPPELMIVAL